MADSRREKDKDLGGNVYNPERKKEQDKSQDLPNRQKPEKTNQSTSNF